MINECIKLVFSRSFTTLRSVLDDNITLAILFLFIPFFSSCEHRELSDPNTGHYLRVYLDDYIIAYYLHKKKRPKNEFHSTLR